MGNNATSTYEAHNRTANYTFPTTKTKLIIAPGVKLRPGLTYEDIMMNVHSALGIHAAVFLINLLILICTGIRLKSIPHMFIQNIVVVDFLSACVTLAPWLVGITFDSYGIVLGSLCRMQGFFHNTLCSVFLGTVAAIGFSSFVKVVSPKIHSAFFVNRHVARLVLFTIWFGAGFLAAPPLNQKTWGEYDKMEGTCWMVWRAGSDASLSYAAFHTVLTLGPALIFTILVLVFVLVKRKSKVEPECGGDEAHTEEDHLDVLYMSTTLLFIFLVVWVPLTVMESEVIKDWRLVDGKVITRFIFLLSSRGLIHPFVYFAISRDMRKAAVDVYIKCSCCAGNHQSDAEASSPKDKD